MILILMIAGWALMFALVLYIWADVRETKNMVSVLRRESLRGSVSVRSSESFPSLRESDFDMTVKENGGEGDAAGDNDAEDSGKDGDSPATEETTARCGSEIKPLEAEDEQILSEVLREFLG